ncbi:MAG: NAD(P)/FAD-dependent oxidoreductase [Lacipirellulaceae bacterium]
MGTELVANPAPIPVHRVVIVGGGFAGLNAAKALRRAPVEVTLIDKRNFHLFQPLLYQVATGGLSPANIAAPLRGVLKRQRNCRVLMAEVRGFDLDARRVMLGDEHVDYDTLIVAAGAGHSYFGHPEWERDAPGLKTIEDATSIRHRVLGAFEQAELTSDHELRRALLNFVVVGAGPTGVELAGALAEIANFSLKHDFRAIDPRDAHVQLIEAGPRVLAAYPDDLSASARKSLEHLGVVVRTETRVEQIDGESVRVCNAQGCEVIPTRTVLWAAGVQASPLAKMLSEATGSPLDRAGRVEVTADLSLPGRPEVLVLGDMAHCKGDDGKPLPGVAPVAITQGKFAAKLVTARLRRSTLPSFRYRNPGNLATIGKSAAVADLGRLHFTGFIAWVLWLFVHLMQIVSFRNRLLVLMQWGWSYFSYDRAARLITGYPAPVERSAPTAGQPQASDPTPKAELVGAP